MKTETRQALFDVLVQLLPSLDDVEQICQLTFNRNLDAVAGRRPLDNALLLMIQQAEARGVLPRLMAVLRQYRADPVPLLRLAEPLGLDEGKAGFERYVFEKCLPTDVERWRRDMVHCERSVCRIESATGDILGTGTLIGPDLIATARHVVDELVRRGHPLTSLRARFDFKTDDRGEEVFPGKLYRAAAGDLVADSPATKLDYALVRLAGNAGHDAPAATSEAQRGWLAPQPHLFEPAEPLSIIQHPEGLPMKFAFGSVKEAYSSPARIKYLINTEGGSSGAPCFTLDWHLVALHQAGANDHNVGVPWSAILEDLKHRGLSLV